jgi:hypothetical protein
MTRFLKHLFLCFAIFLGSDSQLLAQAADAEKAVSSPSGSWKGTWLNHRGHVYDAVVRLNLKPDGTVTGEITWTLKKSPREEEQANIGTTATENIAGTYDAKNRLLSLAGFGKDDPKQVIGLDRYRLLFAENGRTIGGITENHGTWEGVFTLLREKE